MKITGSKWHRIWQCQASAILPQNTSEDLEARTEPARNKGTAIHRYLERVRVVGIDAALSEVPSSLLNLCRALDIDKLPTHLSTEVAYAWNWKTQTARELGRNLGHRDYDLLGVDWSCEVPITTDVTGMAEFSPQGTMELVRRGYVGDYKTGHTKYPRPARFGQILLGAICIRSIMQLDDVIGELLYIDDDGDSFPVRDTIDSWTLDSFERELAGIMDEMPALERTGGEALVKHEGPHCDHCAAFKSCNAKVALVRSVPAELLAVGAKRKPDGGLELVWVPSDKDPKKGEWALDIEPGAITVRNAAAVYEACERVEAICRRMRDEVCGLGYHQPIELSDGRVIELYRWKRRAVNGRIAAQVLERHYPRDKVVEKLDVKLPIAAIRDLVVEHIDPKAKPRPVIESRKGDGVLDVLMDEISKAGGLTVNEGEECKPHQPRKKR